MGRRDLSDEEGALIEPLLPTGYIAGHGRLARTGVFFNGMLYML